MFLDRDGTMIVDKEYIGHPDHVELLPGAAHGLKLLAQKKFLLIVVSNQSGVGRGYFSQKDVENVHHRIQQLLAAQGVKIERFYYCPHRPEENCCCRKPSAELVLAAAKFFDIDLTRSFFVGDKDLDVQTGLAAGCKTVLINSGQYEIDKSVKPNFICKNLFEAAEWIIK